MQAEEQARNLAIEQLKEHVTHAIAQLTLQVEDAMQSVQEATAIVSSGATQISDANRALQEIDEMREGLGRLDLERAQHADRLNAVERGLEELSALHADSVLQQDASLTDTATSLGARIDSVVQEHRKLDTAVADIAKLGLIAAQVARHRRTVQPTGRSRAGLQASGASLEQGCAVSQECSRTPSLATFGSGSSPAPRSRIQPQQTADKVDDPALRSNSCRALVSSFPASPGSCRPPSPTFRGSPPLMLLANAAIGASSRRPSATPQQGPQHIHAPAAMTTAAAVAAASGTVQMHMRRSETPQPRTDVSPTQTRRRQCL